MRNYDISHFRSQPLKYKQIEKICPVCKTKFVIFGWEKTKNKKTCSYSCSNTYFRSGINNPKCKMTNYRTICFYFHKKEYAACKEDKIVEAHHYDENHENNKPENFVPLCPTHHRYWHSRYRYIIEDKVHDYHKNFISKI